ncbi:MAG: adenylate/guanylate cyclase domain-containing protein [Bacteroidota bacterium]|nr:adenylate/guanylate cyclase domain-containing protein [Bacteroidota bacterium]
MKKWLVHIRFYICGWFFASIFFYIMRNVGVIGPRHLHFTIDKLIFLIPVFAILSGLIFGSLQYFFEQYVFRKIPLWKLMVRLCIDQLLIISLITVIYYFVISIMEMNILNFWDFLRSPSAFIYYMYVFLVNSTLSLLLEINRLLGKGNFFKLIMGKFYSPVEEYRIFMFIDLNSSTTIAEKLGHLSYSNFIKDCFYDLAVVHDYGAQIYQYVGDEAVLTWERPKMKSVLECVDAFWAFDDALKKKSEYYFNKYGIIPEFKAGMSIGMVTVVEIGDLKKEIAYHGNTLNTAARIEAVCNLYNEKLLVSKKLYDELIKENSSYKFKKVAVTQLKGKQGTTEIYSINRTAKIPATVMA